MPLNSEISSIHVKFRYSEKAPKIWPIFHNTKKCQKKSGRWVKCLWSSQSSYLFVEERISKESISSYSEPLEVPLFYKQITKERTFLEALCVLLALAICPIHKYFFLIIGLKYAEVRDWYSKGYTSVVEIAERDLLCDPLYYNIYLIWSNFMVKFVVPTIILIGCSIKIFIEVMF